MSLWESREDTKSSMPDGVDASAPRLLAYIDTKNQRISSRPARVLVCTVKAPNGVREKLEPSLTKESGATHLATKACCPVPPAPARVVGPAGRSSGLCCRLEKQQKGCTAKMLTQLCLGRLRVLSMFRFTPVRSFQHPFTARRERLRLSFLSAQF